MFLRSRRVFAVISALALGLAVASCGSTDESPQGSSESAGESPSSTEGGSVASSADDSGSSESTDSESAGSKSSPAEQTSLTFRTDFLPSGRYSAFYYAKEKGYYQDAGLDVELNTGKGSSVTAQDVGAGHTDIGMVDGSVAAISIGQGVPITVVGMFAGKNQFGMFIDKKLGIDSIKGLKGHSVVIKPGTSEALLFPAVMSYVGLDDSQYKAINIDPAAAQGAYNGGTGDALADDIAEATPSIKRDSTVVAWADTGLVLPGYAFIVNNDFLQSNPDAVASFLTATYKAMGDAFDDQEAAEALVAEQFGTLPEDVIKAQFSTEEEYLCSDAMTEAGQPIGFPNKDDWSSALEPLKEYAGVPKKVTVDDIMTDKFFTDEFDVSQQTCQ